MAEEQRPRYELMAFSAKGGFLQVVQDEKTWAREIMFALQILRGSDMLQRADQESIKNAVVNIALCGTTLNPAMNMAYLVPRDGKCCLDISYRGLAQIAMDSGGVKHIAPRLVYSFDTFEYCEEDGEPHIKHTPSFTPPPEFTAGPEKFWDFLVCGYTVATLPDGTKIVTQPLPKWKLEKAMKTSKTSSGKTPWRTHPDEMALKTLVKHAYKLLPQTDRMSNAVTILNEQEGLDTGRGAAGGSTASDLMNRFGFDQGGAPETADDFTPDRCPSCQGLRVEGKCHSSTCDLGEPPPGV
jgi:recombination protein RecT